MRVRAIVVVCSVLVTVAACGTTTPTSQPAPTTTTTSTTPSTTRPSTTTKPTTPPTTSTGPTTASVFRVDLTVQRSGLGLLAITNTAKHPAAVQGWPTLRFYNSADESLAVPVRKVDVPGAGPKITIGPGETAFAGVRWTVGDRADPKTFVATTLRLTPPGGSQQVTVNVIGTDGQIAEFPELDLTTAEIGTLQPSSQGVLVF
ncbi:MAG TPA: DUF4232 domain-containing protein [Pseudonocardiaceae bacterium]|nr:DUF4232 domain-containing protein [Pseudonocardiaceae bacterium]